MIQDQEALPDSSPATAISPYPSPGSSVLILPSPHESDASNRSTPFPSVPDPKPSVAAGGLPVFDTGSTESVNSVQAVVGSVNTTMTTSTTTTTTTGDEMIMPDEAIETGDFRYPTPETFGPQYWERRRELFLSGNLYPPESQAGVKPYSGSRDLPWTSPEAANAGVGGSGNNGTGSGGHGSLSHYLGLSLKARGKLPSFLVNALPSSSSGPAHTSTTSANPTVSANGNGNPPVQNHGTGGPITPSNPSSLAQDRASAQTQPMSYASYQSARSSPSSLSSIWSHKKGGTGEDPIDRLEALLAEPGSEESDRAWKQGGLEAVWKFLIDGKPLKRGIRLGLAVKILRAGWIHDGTWPASYTLTGGSRAQLDSLNNDPFFASPPRMNKTLPPNEFVVGPQDGVGKTEDPIEGHTDEPRANNDNNGIHVDASGDVRGHKDVL